MRWTENLQRQIQGHINREWDRRIGTGKGTEEQVQGDRGTATVTWTVGEGISEQGQRGKNRQRDEIVRDGQGERDRDCDRQTGTGT